MSSRTARYAAAVALLMATGCAAVSNSAVATPAPKGAHNTLHVRVLLYGGPLLPNGHMALNGAPEGGVRVSVRAGRTTLIAVTNKTGRATFNLQSYQGRVMITEKNLGCRTQARVPTTKTVIVRCDVP